LNHWGSTCSTLRAEQLPCHYLYSLLMFIDDFPFALLAIFRRNGCCFNLALGANRRATSPLYRTGTQHLAPARCRHAPEQRTATSLAAIVL
jgi:hypothetical protein